MVEVWYTDRPYVMTQPGHYKHNKITMFAIHPYISTSHLGFNLKIGRN